MTTDTRDEKLLLECLCGARDEIDPDQPTPKCWLCGKPMMIFGRRRVR